VPGGPKTLQSVRDAEPTGKFVKFPVGTGGVSKLPLSIILALAVTADANRPMAEAMMIGKGFISCSRVNARRM